MAIKWDYYKNLPCGRTQPKATKINKDTVLLVLILRAQGILINYPHFLRVKGRSAEVTDFGTLGHKTDQVLPPSEESLMSRSGLTSSPRPQESTPTMDLF